MRETVSSFKTRFSSDEVLNLATSDPRWMNLLNEALQRLLAPGMYVGTTGRYQVCSSNATVTWPRAWETIEALDICEQPVTLRNQWYEFLESGPGLTLIKCCSTMKSIDRGRGYAMFADIPYDQAVIRLYPQLGVDDGKLVTIRGLDLNGMTVLTNVGNTLGEEIALDSPFIDSVTVWKKQAIRDVIKVKTKGFVRACCYDATLPPPPAVPGPLDTPLFELAMWEPGETLPDYRRSFIPALEHLPGGCKTCCNGDDFADCGTQPTLTVIAKHQFIPVENDPDFLPLGNAPAVKLAMRAVMLESRGDIAGSNANMYGTWNPVLKRFINGAVPLLEEELASFQGDGTVITIRRDPDRLGGSGVTTFI